MGIVAELPRSSALAWAPSGTGAMLAAAPAADIFDASFDAGGRLELLALDVHAPALRLRAAAPCPERAHAVAWGAPSTSPGLVAAALEGGAVSVWDASALLRLPLASAGGADGGGAAAAATVVSAGTGAHAGAARAVEWNPRVPTLLASAGDDGHVLVWDFGRGAGGGAPVTPLTPVGVAPAPPGASGADAPAGAAPAKEAMLSVAWNRQMQQILAGGGAAGVTAVWDLRQKRRVIALRHPRGRLTCSGLAWSPTVATQLLTASAERGALLWDLRNATAPLRSLRHHRAGIAAVSWCPQDSGLLLTAGHDGATLVVDPASGDVLSSVSHVGGGGGEASGAGAGVDGGDTDSLDGGVVRGDFGLGWNPRLPGVFATASRDGRIAVQSLLTASVASSVSSATASALSTAFGGEFVSGATAESPRVTAAGSPEGTLMSRSPAWLARRACLSFGPCGRPVAVISGGAAGAKGVSPTSVVRLHPRVQTEETFVSAALALERDVGGPEADLASLAAYCDEKAENVGEDGGDDGPVERVSWALLALQLRPHARQQLLSHLGFAVPAVAQSSAEGVVGLEASPPLCSMQGDAPEPAAVPMSPPPVQDTGSYALQSPVSGMPQSPAPYTDTPHVAANLDGPAPWDVPDSTGAAPPTVSGMGSILDGDPSGGALDGSSAAVFGDGSGAINGGKPTPSGDAKGTDGDDDNADVLTAAHVDVEDASAVDRFVSRSVLVGDFSAAVDASLRTGRFADALLLARRGGDDLWRRAADAVMATSPPPAPTAALAAASAAVAGRVSLERAADWRDALAAAVTFSGGPELSASARAIAAQIVEGKDDSLTGDAATEAAITCYIAAGDTAAAADVWLSSLAATRSASRLPELTAAVAKIRLLASAVCAGRGDTADLGSVRALDATSASALVAFGRTLAAAGQPGLAVAYFANIESAADDADLARNAAAPAYAPEPAVAQSQEQYGQAQQSAYGQPQQQPHGFGQSSQPSFGQQQHPGSAGYGSTSGGYPQAGQYAGSSFAPAPAAGGFGTPANGFGNGAPQGGAAAGGAGFYGAQQQPSTPVPASSPAYQAPQPPTMASFMPPVPAPPQSFGSPSPSASGQSGPTPWGAPAAAPALPPMPLAPAAAPLQGAPPAPGSNFGAPMPFGPGSSPQPPAYQQQQQPAYTQPTMPAMPSLPPPMPSFSGGVGGDVGSGGFGGGANAASMPPSMPGAASALPPPPPPPPPPSDPTAMPGGVPFNPNARARVGGDGGRPRLPPSAEVAGVVRKPAGAPGGPGAPPVGMSRSSSASSALGALSVAGSDAAGGGGGGAKLASLPAVAVDAADVSAVPREQAAIPRALCGSFAYTAQLSSTPVFRRKMDDVSRKLGRLLSALNAGIVDAAVIAHLLRLAGALEKGDYDEAASVVQVLTREHWDEHGSWIQALQRMIQSARTGR